MRDQIPEGWLNNVIQGDCLELMKSLPDKCVDLAIVDPPYGLGMDGGKRYDRPSRPNSYHTRTKHQKLKWDSSIPPKLYFEELKRTSANQIIFGGNYFVQFLLPSMGWIYWGKMEDSSNFSDGELIFTSFKRALKSFYCHQFNGTNGGKDRLHPTQKPTKLYRWILKNYAQEGNFILDTHFGSGSLGVACLQMGFNFIGFEIEPKYVEIAKKRIQAEKNQLKLF